MPRLLIVDDDKAARLAIQMVLSWGNYHTTLCENGKSALDLSLKENFDLLITDIFMPEHDGLELINHFRRLYPATPIIAVSGGARRIEGDFLRLALKLGASYAIRKPFSHLELKEAVAEALEVSRIVRNS